MKITDALKDAFSANLFKLLSYKFWLTTFIVSFYIDLILTFNQSILFADLNKIALKSVILLILSSGILLGGLYIVFIMLRILTYPIALKVKSKENNDYSDKNKILGTSLSKYANINNRPDLLEYVKTHDLENKNRSLISFFNFLLLVLIGANIHFNGILVDLLQKTTLSNSSLTYPLIYFCIAVLLIINAINSFLNDHNSFIDLDYEIQEKLEIRIRSSFRSE